MVLTDCEQLDYGENIVKNYPALGSGSKYDKSGKLNLYVTESGLTFDPKKEITVEDFSKIHKESVVKVADCNFCDRDNVPILYKKDGQPYKVQKVVIESSDHIDDLVVYQGVHEDWDNGSFEWLYFLTYDGHIVKIGKTTTSLKVRYASYACGDRKARQSGTCSVTNFLINEANYAALLQGYKVEIFGIRVPKTREKITFAGVTTVLTHSCVTGKEEILTDVFIENTGHKPVLCVQKGSSTSEEESIS